MAGEQTAVLPQSDPGSFRMNEQPNNRIMLNGLPILAAIVGSPIYGLENAGSGPHYLGVYIADTDRILGLYPVAETTRRVDPDMVFHELGKFVRLALDCDPMVLDLLWAEDRHLCDEQHGKRLVELRSLFLSKLVLETYECHVRCQVLLMESALERRYYDRHARYALRLLQQWYELVTTGNISTKSLDTEELRDAAKLPFGEFKYLVEKKIAEITTSPCVLPDKPDKSTIDEFLVSTRYKCHGLEPVLGAPLNAHQAVVPEFSWVWAWGG